MAECLDDCNLSHRLSNFGISRRLNDPGFSLDYDYRTIKLYDCTKFCLLVTSDWNHFVSSVYLYLYYKVV